MSPTKRASGVPGLRAAIQAAPAAPPAPADASPRAERDASREALNDASRPAAADAPPPPTGRRPRPPKPIRYTLDLAPDDHLFLRRFAVDAGVNASAVVRALLGRLRDDPELAAEVRADAWAQ